MFTLHGISKTKNTFSNSLLLCLIVTLPGLFSHVTFAQQRVFQDVADPDHILTQISDNEWQERFSDGRMFNYQTWWLNSGTGPRIGIRDSSRNLDLFLDVSKAEQTISVRDNATNQTSNFNVRPYSGANTNASALQPSPPVIQQQSTVTLQPELFTPPRHSELNAVNAIFSGRAIKNCPAGSKPYSLVDGGTCWACPTGFEHVFLGDIKGNKACRHGGGETLTRANLTTYRLLQACPGGYKPDPLSGKCFACPAGFQRTGYSVLGDKACSKLNPVQFARASNKGRFLGCLAGSEFDLVDGGTCWSCPTGFERSWSHVKQADACVKPIIGNRFRELSRRAERIMPKVKPEIDMASEHFAGLMQADSGLMNRVAVAQKTGNQREVFKLLRLQELIQKLEAQGRYSEIAPGTRRALWRPEQSPWPIETIQSGSESGRVWQTKGTPGSGLSFVVGGSFTGGSAGIVGGAFVDIVSAYDTPFELSGTASCYTRSAFLIPTVGFSLNLVAFGDMKIPFNELEGRYEGFMPGIHVAGGLKVMFLWDHDSPAYVGWNLIIGAGIEVNIAYIDLTYWKNCSNG